MKISVFVCIFFLTCQLQNLTADDQIISISQQAHALAGAHDYTQASELYEQLEKLSLPKWQNVRIQYNLGTLKLAQKQSTDALKIFQSIQPFDLSLPRFAQNLFINEGIAYLKQAQNSSNLLEKQLFFIEQSLQAFQEAQILNCQEEFIKQSCQPNSLVEQWLQNAHLQLEQSHQQERQRWIKQTSLENLVNVLFNNLKKWLQITQNFQTQKTNLDLSTLAYLQQQAQSLSPIWEALKQKENKLDSAFASYANILQAFKKQDTTSIIRDAQATLDALASWAFNSGSLQQISLNYQILLLQDTLTLSKMQALKADLAQLKIEEQASKMLPNIQQNLQTSLKNLQAKQNQAARFFLLASFSQFQLLLNEKKEQQTPLNILQQILEQARHALQLSFLSILIPKDSQDQTVFQKVLENQQKRVLKGVKPFIQAVLIEQKAHFEKAQCQRFPWDQVIPLFDKGYQAAQEADKELKNNPVNKQALIAQQEQTVQNWQKALDLLLHPPSPKNQKSDNKTSPALNETFRLVQEMYLEDQAQPPKEIQELHAW